MVFEGVKIIEETWVFRVFFGCRVCTDKKGLKKNNLGP